MEKVSWVERKTNEEVLVDEKRELLYRINKTKRRWTGHIIFSNRLLKEAIESRIDGIRPKGRKRIGILSELKEDGYAKMKSGLKTERPGEAECQGGPVGRERNCWVQGATAPQISTCRQVRYFCRLI